MSNSFFQKIEQTVREYITREMRIKKFQEIAFAIGKAGEQIDADRIRALLLTVDNDANNVAKYLSHFGRYHAKGWEVFTKNFLDKYSKEQSIDIPR